MDINLQQLIDLLERANDPKLNKFLYRFAEGYLFGQKEKAPKEAATSGKDANSIIQPHYIKRSDKVNV